MISIKKYINFFEEFLYLIKIKYKYKNNFTIGGKCLICGNCCRKLTLTHNNKLIKDYSLWEKIKSDYPIYEIFECIGVEKDFLIFRCTKIGDDNKCTIYNKRPKVCRKYPDFKQIKKFPEEFEDCGFYLEKKFKFKDYLNKIK